jgi:hypothetical protein
MRISGNLYYCWFFIAAEYVEKQLRPYREFVHQEHLRDVKEALKSYFKR